MTYMRILGIVASVIVNFCWVLSAKSIVSVRVLESLSNQQPDSLTLTVTNASDSVVFSMFEPSRVTEWNGRKMVSFGEFNFAMGDYIRHYPCRLGYLTFDNITLLFNNLSRNNA